MTLRAGIDFYAAKAVKPLRLRSYPARLPRIEDVTLPGHDGDTWTLSFDRGDGWENKVKIRGFNVFAPELKQVGGPECRQFANRWLVAPSGLIWPFWVDTVLDGNGHEIETLGRSVCIVRNAVTAVSLNDEMNAYIDANGFPRGTGG
jgi:hypothetical protein